MKKLKIFVIMPFDPELNDLYGHFKSLYEEKAEFIRADDFLNQQNILKDIVLPIFESNLIIADLTGLNANVFYELGLAHAFRKKVVLMTQDISELPFDLRSYRVIEYSTHFARIKDLEEKIERIIDEYNSVSFGSPVTDWISLEDQVKSLLPATSETQLVKVIEETPTSIVQNNPIDEKGFLDFIVDLEASLEGISNLVVEFGEKTTDIGTNVNTNSIIVDKTIKSGSSATSIRKIARIIAGSLQEYGQYVGNFNGSYEELWNVVEESLTNLINSPFVSTDVNKEHLDGLITTLSEVKDIMIDSKSQVGEMAEGVKGLIGIEVTISRAASLIFREIKQFEGLIDKSVSTLERVTIISEDRKLM